MKTKLKSKRSRCPIAGWLDFFGDKWTLTLVRDMVLGKKRYGEFQQSPEGIPTNILADRLKKLERAGVIEKRPYSKRPLRHDYLLTDRGRGLAPVLREMSRWAQDHVDKVMSPPDGFWEEKAGDGD